MGDSEDTCFLGLSFGVSPVGKAVSRKELLEGSSPKVTPAYFVGGRSLTGLPAAPGRGAFFPPDASSWSKAAMLG